MRRKVENPRIILLNWVLKYKKGESQIKLEFTKDIYFTAGFRRRKKKIKALKPDVAVTEKGNLASYYLQKTNISINRILKKTDNNFSKSNRNVFVNRPEELQDVGTK